MIGFRILLAVAGRGLEQAPAAITWNPDDKDINITLSNANLTAAQISQSFSISGVRATLGRSAGKHYFEARCDTRSGNDVHAGIIQANDTTWFSSTVMRVYRFNGKKKEGSNETTYDSSYTDGNVIGIAVDLDAGKVWFAKNNSWQASGDPAASTGAAFTNLGSGVEWFPFVMCYANGSQWTGRFKSGDFSYSPPSGFSAWES